MLDLTKYNVILGSKSPRRQELFKVIWSDFTIQTKNTAEDYPNNLNSNQISEYLCKKKSNAFGELTTKQMLITADTIVWQNNQSLAKPQNKSQAKEMLSNLSGADHHVFTSVYIRTKQQAQSLTASTKVTFKPLLVNEMDYYLDNYEFMDKAGAYGIQDWIGCIGIQKIEGCFYNVMGLPLQQLYTTLYKFSL